MNYIKIGIVIAAAAGLLLTTAIGAHTKGKTPRTRVGEVFQTFKTELPKVIGPTKHALRLPPSSSTYLFDHDIWHWSGKAIFHQECPFDFRNDPGEASCRLVWAAI